MLCWPDPDRSVGRIRTAVRRSMSNRDPSPACAYERATRIGSFGPRFSSVLGYPFTG